MSNQDYFRELSGNKFSLRAKSANQIKKIDGLNRVLGALGDVLISTWGGISLAIVCNGLGLFLIFFIAKAYDFALVLTNLIPMILVMLGILLISINILLTNPSFGSQILVSINYIKNKIKNRNIIGKKQTLDIFRQNDDMQSVIELNDNGKIYYITAFSVRGSVSPVSFEQELHQLATIDRQLLSNLERDVTLITLNSIQKADIRKKDLPSNATPAMVAKRNQKYKATSSLKHNQQLNTLIFLSSMNYNSLLAKTENVKVAFNRGLVIGYVQLQGRALKKGIYQIYGKK